VLLKYMLNQRSLSKKKLAHPVQIEQIMPLRSCRGRA
jgi:hypothetical protein